MNEACSVVMAEKAVAEIRGRLKGHEEVEERLKSSYL